MIDVSLIKENYARMSNEELINLSQTEGQVLTGEALSLLHDEFLHRNLDTSVFGSIDDNKTARQKRNLQQAEENASNEFIQSLWTFAFDGKEKGKSNEEIQKGLIEKGLGEEYAVIMVNNIEPNAKQVLDALDKSMLAGGLTCAVGVIITLWTLSAAQGGGTYVVAWGAIVFGAIRFFKGLSGKGKYNRILKNIQSETVVVAEVES